MSTMMKIPDYSKLRVVVFGDLMLDEYIWGDVSRISPEAPVPVVKVEKTIYRLGGAGNVAANLAGLGCQVALIGTVGSDRYGEIVKQCVAEIAIDDRLLTIDELTTIRKTRVMGVGQQLVRIDRENPEKMVDNHLENLWHHFKNAIGNTDVVILSDYGKGCLHPKWIKSCIDLCRSKAIPVFADTKANDWLPYRGATCITPNERELDDIYRHLTGAAESDSLENMGAKVCTTIELDWLLVTRGKDGMSLFEPNQPVLPMPSQAKEVYDVSGAGDTVIAVLAASYAAGSSMPTAMALANTAAEVAVGKTGTHAISLDEIHHAVSVATKGPRHKICPLDQGLEKVIRWRNEKRTIVFTNGCFDLLHTGHIHLLQSAAKEGDRLIVGLNTDASIRKLKGPSRPVLGEQDRAAILAALGCVDMVILFAQETPINLIETIRPDVIAKGADYSKKEVVGADLVEDWGGKVVLISLEKGKSTSILIESIANGNEKSAKP